MKSGSYEHDGQSHVFRALQEKDGYSFRRDSSPRWNVSFFLCFSQTELADEVTNHEKAFSVEVKSEIFEVLLFSPDASDPTEDLGLALLCDC
jgi:hypothetical protein